MTVSSCRSDFLVYNQEIYQFLLAVREKCARNNTTKIASVSLDINLVDPLVVLAKLAQVNQVTFYWENQASGESIVAIDAVAKLEVAGKERFSKAQKFIQDCLDSLVNFKQNKTNFLQPRFFCSFSFFDENSQLGYPFSPGTVFLPSWQVAVKNNRCHVTINVAIDASVNISTILHVLWTKLEFIQSLTYHPSHTGNYLGKFSQKLVENPEKFKASVLSALKAIKTGQFSKIVLASALDVYSTTSFNLLKSLSNLRQLHPNCYIFSTSNGKGQSFIGASPERLINVQERQLVTDALAGSAPRGKTPEEDAKNANLLLQSQKERHEHSLVMDFITQQLLKLGLLPQVVAPRLRQLSNIQHLWTPIQAIVPASVHPLQIVAHLHPTPAVAGSERDIAMNKIQQYETFERGLYAAPLGWVDADGNCEFIVGIRSALIDGNRARLYAGAGIVAGSDPEKELAEIQLKFQALLKALV
ncbi:MAG: isochorismate synthase [Calothrix sp. C42_A2020_038]|nr:isochorismate synthase [Calothrix sp. C42_A2020_038]